MVYHLKCFFWLYSCSTVIKACFFYKNNFHLNVCNVENPILETCLLLHINTFVSNFTVLHPLKIFDIFTGYGNLILETN